ncbi:MAG: serine/threonine-protein kinase, partial [Planctomycetota bacterium]
ASAEREELRQRFVCEATLLAGLQHPCIPVIYDLGETQDGRPFYTQKPLGGGSWSDVFRRNKRHENLQILSRVADGIGFAHDRGFLHRDIQPDSVVLQAFGEVTIIEWGVAVNLERRQELSQAGTPAYMAPEMARHDIEKIGIRSDVYLLGATLFEIITGKAPHDHGHKSADEKLADAAANKIVAVEASDPLLAVAYTAMAADPEERYESAAEFQDALSRG